MGTDYKTMRVPEDAWEQANKARGESETWGEYLLRCAEEPAIELSKQELRRIIRQEIRDKVHENARL